MKEVIYTGFFINDEEVRQVLMPSLEKGINNMHVTHAFRPKEFNKELFGETVEITVIGFANDGKNEGVLVKLHSDNPKINKVIEEIKTPHITLSISADGKPVDTGKLNFAPVEEQVSFTGVYGAFTPQGVIFK